MIKTYVNNRNEHKFLEVQKSPCSHFYARQYIQNNGSKSYMGTTIKRSHIGIWSRLRKSTLAEILEDYREIEK